MSENESNINKSELPFKNTGYFVPIAELNSQNGVDLLELWGIVWSSRRKLFVSAILVSVIMIVILLLMPNIYRANVLLSPISDKKNSSSLVSTLGGFSGLASLAGINIGSPSTAEENIAVLKSREFIWNFIQEENLMPILYKDDWDKSRKAWKDEDPDEQPTLWSAYRLFIEDKLLTTSKDSESGLITITIEWQDPILAADWANKIVMKLNDYLRSEAIERSNRNLKYLSEQLQKIQISDMQKTLYTLIAEEQHKAMIASTQKEYAFRIVDPAVPPDKKAKPKRLLILIITVLFFEVFFVIYLLLNHALKNKKLN